MKKLLLRIGLIRIRRDGSTHWPLRVVRGSIGHGSRRAPHWRLFLNWFLRKTPRAKPVGLFKYNPLIHSRIGPKYSPGKLLPRRWGFHIFGLEIGDRG